MKPFALFLVGVLGLSLSGCVSDTPSGQVWYQPGFDRVRTQNDLAWCTAQADASGVGIAAEPGLLPAAAASQRHAQLVRNLMMSKGYRLVPTNSLPTGVSPVTDGHGLTYPAAKELALLLTVGMSDEQVHKLLGLPDETSVQTRGQATAEGDWQAYTWVYRFSTPYNSRALNVVFQQTPTGTWVINSWGWNP